jgi:hypothetical protein
VAAGFLSPLPVLGFSGSPVSTQAGYRSLLAPWLGGAASGPAAPTVAGYRSLLAPWLGGAWSGIGSPVLATAPASGGGGGEAFLHHHDGRLDRLRRDERDVLEILLLIAPHL